MIFIQFYTILNNSNIYTYMSISKNILIFLIENRKKEKAPIFRGFLLTKKQVLFCSRMVETIRLELMTSTMST